MKNLMFYLNNAQDFLEGTNGAARVIEYYMKNAEHAENLWTQLLRDGKTSPEYNDFVSLLGTYGLYIQNETRVDPRDRDKFHPVEFSMRVYPFGDHKVAVLKTEHLPS